MSKAVLISIHPKWCEKIAGGEKTIEVRKTRPKLKPPFRCYIYCTAETAGYDALWVLDAPSRKKYSLTAVSAYLERAEGASKGNRKIIGEFTCGCITPLYNVCTDDWSQLIGGLHEIEKTLVRDYAKITEKELREYANGSKCFAWHISGLRIYDTPRELGEFTGLRDTRFGAAPYDIKRAPQSWCYVEEQT